MTPEASGRASSEIDLKAVSLLVEEALDLVEKRGNFLDLIHDDVSDFCRQGAGLASKTRGIGFKPAALIGGAKVKNNRRLPRNDALQKLGLPCLTGAEKQPNLVSGNTGRKGACKVSSVNFSMALFHCLGIISKGSFPSCM